jgi:hypothetical protein
VRWQSPASYSIEVEPTKKTEDIVALNISVSQTSGSASKVLFKTIMETQNGHSAEVTHEQMGLKELRLVITPTF